MIDRSRDYSRRPPESGGRLKALERPARLAALMLLCALVWWFSYDHGRQATRGGSARLEAENISLREKVALLEMEVKDLNRRLKEADRAAAPDAGSSAQSAQTGDAESLGDSGRPGGQAELAPAPAARASGEPLRLTVKLSENKGLFDGRVVLTMVELDSLDQEALVRAHYRETGRRVAQLMVPGDVMELDLDGERRRLYLDQIRGTLAFFIIDGMPGGNAR